MSFFFLTKVYHLLTDQRFVELGNVSLRQKLGNNTLALIYYFMFQLASLTIPFSFFQTLGKKDFSIFYLSLKAAMSQDIPSLQKQIRKYQWKVYKWQILQMLMLAFKNKNNKENKDEPAKMWLNKPIWVWTVYALHTNWLFNCFSFPGFNSLSQFHSWLKMSLC